MKNWKSQSLSLSLSLSQIHNHIYMHSALKQTTTIIYFNKPTHNAQTNPKANTTPSPIDHPVNNEHWPWVILTNQQPSPWLREIERRTKRERSRERDEQRERERDKWNWSVRERERERERKVLSWSERVAVRVFMVALTLTLGHRSSLSQASMLQREKRTGRLRMKTKWDLPCFLFSFSFFDSFFFNFLLITNFFFFKKGPNLIVAVTET